MQTPRLFLSPPHLSGLEQEYLAEALSSNWVAPVGPHLNLFEMRFSEYLGIGGSVAVASGTAAIHLALRTLNLQPDDEVLCSTLTFCASANPVIYEGAKPVFIDSARDTWNIDPNLVEDELNSCAARGKLPRAMIAVDIFGQGSDIDALNEIASRYEIPVIEDAAEALGATYRGRKVGAKAWANIFSFNGNKIITSGGGGMLCSDDQALLDTARFLATQARDPAPHYEHSCVGFNYRMSNVLAAIGLGQLDVIDERVASRRRIFAHYQDHLRRLPGITFMPEALHGQSNRWLTVIQIDPEQFGATPEQVRLALEEQNIESRPVWKPLHCQPVYANCRRRGGAIAERIFQQGLCLPSGSAMTEAQLQRVIEIVKNTGTSRRRNAA